ncbi:hypothetical protein EJB05_14963, partial [Eragrostis curvula]
MENSGRRSSPAGATKIDDLIDDLVELILLHIPCRAGLVRSAATCKRWRRLIAGTGFLRRFRSLHRPRVVGHYCCVMRKAAVNAVFNHAPKPPPGATATFAPKSNYPLSMFHLTKLPHSTLTDSRGGLVAGFLHLDNSGVVVVFNPWIRKHKKLHAPACGRDKTYADCLGAFLLDDDDDTGSMSHFKVLCVHLLRQQCSNDDDSKKKFTVEAQVYSARDDTWLLLSTTAVDADDIAGHVSYTKPAFVFLGRAGGSLFWFAKKSVFHLNEVTGTFFSLTLPRPPVLDDDANSGSQIMISYGRSNLRVVDTGSTARLVRIVGDVLDVLRHNATCVVLERRVHLPTQLLAASSMESSMSWCFVNCMDEQLADRVVLSSPRDRRMFVVDVDNMTKLLVPTQTRDKSLLLPVDWVLPYEHPWPPIILERRA